MIPNPFKNKLLVCDLDGTLLDSKHELSEESRKAVERFIAGGGLFTIATGRMRTGVEALVRKLSVNLPVILYNGSVIYDFTNNTVLWQTGLGDEIGGTIKKIMDRFPGAGIEMFNLQGISVLQQNDEILRHRQRQVFDPQPVPLETVGKPWYKVLIAWENHKLLEVEEFVRNNPGGFRPVFSEPQFLELLPLGVSKGRALEKLVEILGMECSDVIAMGDNLNDLEMIQCAGIGIAVENAHEDLKAISRFCCRSNDDNAICEVIDWIEQGKLGTK